jgi:putative tryptophan/tyrosine transport system substrate-binding protein
MMRRRDFITLFGGTAAAWPLAARAQQSDRVWRIGYLSSNEEPGEPEAQNQRRIMEEALARLGYIEGKNLLIERRLLGGQAERVNVAAAELLALHPDVIVAVNTPDVAAVLSLTRTVPVVFINPADPIASGFIASLARPGGNATGTTGLTVELISKRLEVLHEMVPGANRLGVISMEKGISPSLDATNQIKLDATATVAKALGMSIEWRPLSKSRDVDALFTSIVAAGDELLYVVFDPLTFQAQKRIAELAIEHKIPAVYEIRDYVVSGGLMSYTYLRAYNFERAAAFVAKILKGDKPADLPVEQPVRFEFVINLKTAKALGLDVPPTLLATTDEAIE